MKTLRTEQIVSVLLVAAITIHAEVLVFAVVLTAHVHAQPACNSPSQLASCPHTPARTSPIDRLPATSAEVEVRGGSVAENVHVGSPIDTAAKSRPN